ncbi:uncharacterized protein [Periplaneta americana]|uniref:uncharacterized protein isoform X3 n=1 Tax=Periplaneta americana TaxID=6978 RepID=UPI0037E75315
MNNTSLVLLYFLMSCMGLNIHAQLKNDSENDSTEEDNTEEDSMYDDFVIDSSESGNQPVFVIPFLAKLLRNPFSDYKGTVQQGNILS